MPWAAERRVQPRTTAVAQRPAERTQAAAERRQATPTRWPVIASAGARGAGWVLAWVAAWVLTSAGAPAVAAPQAADGPLGMALQPFGPPSGAASAPAAPWVLALLPDQKPPATRFTVEPADGETVLRVDAQGSYGNLLHPLPGGAPPGPLTWRWRLDQANPLADLRRREADDNNLRVCALFDLPLAQVPFVERQVLRLARARTAAALPAATVCYVWDTRWPAGTVIDNPHSRRVRSLVLRHTASAPPGRWVDEQRDLAADFLRLFGDEAGGQVPALVGIAVGADADNTGGHSAGRLARLQWR